MLTVSQYYPNKYSHIKHKLHNKIHKGCIVKKDYSVKLTSTVSVKAIIRQDIKLDRSPDSL